MALGYLLPLAKDFCLDAAFVALEHGADQGLVSHRHDVKRIASFR